MRIFSVGLGANSTLAGARWMAVTIFALASLNAAAAPLSACVKMLTPAGTEAMIQRFKSHITETYGATIRSDNSSRDFIRAVTHSDGNVPSIDVPLSLTGQPLLLELAGVINSLERLQWILKNGADIVLVGLSSRTLDLALLDAAPGAHPALRWAAARARRHQITFAFNERPFVDDYKAAGGLATGSAITLRPDYLGEDDLGSIMGHEIVHATNFALCLQKFIRCEEMIRVTPTDALFTELGAIYEKGYRVDEFEAFAVGGKIGAQLPSTVRARQFRRHQLMWLRALREKLALRNPLPNELRTLKTVIESLTFPVPMDISIQLPPGRSTLDLVTERIRNLENFGRAHP